MHIFTRTWQLAWGVLFAASILIEIIPVPLMPAVPSYLYCASKALLFFLLGSVVPLAFSSFYGLNRGIVFAAISTCVVEGLQVFVGGNHTFHWYELLIKFAFVVFGFGVALNARYEGAISFGPLCIRLNTV